MKNQDYRPINCNYYDELVLIAMRKKSVEVIYKNESSKELTIKSIIKDIITKDKIEYVVLEDDLKIRLDKLIQVDGKTVIL